MCEQVTDGCLALVQLMQAHTGRPVRPEEMQTVAEGASGRCIMRSSDTACEGLIGIYWTPARADNGSFLPAAHGLKRLGVRVPAVLAEAELPGGCGACLVEDLGRCSLLSMKDEPWRRRKEAYTAALRQLHKLHSVPVDWPLQPPFDASLYSWEQGYFVQHYLQRHRSLSTQQAQALAEAPIWSALAEALAALPRVPVHRDCQSQNIMLREGDAWFIDFQGMRMGLPEYDLASLLYDPYMALQEQERAELMEIWVQITASPLRKDIYAACALQRLMQALGAFANIGYNAHQEWYLNLIPAGERALLQVCDMALPYPLTSPLAQCLIPLVTAST